MDLVSFTAIMGIPCAEDSVPLDTGLYPMTADKVAYIQTLLGMVPEMKGMHSLKFDSIRAHFTHERVVAATTRREIDHVVRSFLLYLLGTTLFVDAANSLDLIFVIPLRDLDLVASYDWGS